MLIASCLPSIMTRLSVVVSVMLTFLYTKYLKPTTWAKNLVCAFIIAFSPCASGFTALHYLRDLDSAKQIVTVPALWRLFGVLFAGFLGREILMDCNDVVDDEAAGIRTIPVVHGKPFATKVALLSEVAQGFIAIAPHAMQLFSAGISLAPMRRAALAGVGCATHVLSSWRIWKTGGEECCTLISKFVDLNLLTLGWFFASFI